ncbi:acyltransferase family protein [Bradyrhizobium yuanmingense]|uniref:nodulation factor fucose acetyltransferase NolL n=1 Tax=Bradyrhizobium yuanmingense TaxID=108015 RepID=UPI0012FCD2EA|nr:nodulation factor fucose acetyltransferase NolL [Bradyrhizobium yuanmingense]MDF0498364.1 acyltransferase family protein [Bradyrhizobium yuanmingense]MVT55549.1 acyltransferase family protein [Bradyrhizobium yuanmingense]
MFCYAARSTRQRSQSAEADSRDLKFDFAKGMLIILVISGHLTQYVIYGDNGYWYSPYFKSIYMFHMPLFMAISGYLSSKALLRKSLARSVGERAMQLLLPTLFWCTLMETAKLAAFKLAGASPLNSVTGGLSDFAMDLTGSYWFIWATFASFLAIRLLLAVCGRSSMCVICISAIVVALVPVTVSIVPLLRYTYPFFCLGFLFAQSSEWRTHIISRHKLLLKLSLAAITCACYLSWGKETYVYNNLVLIHDTASAKQVLLMFLGSAAASAIVMELVLQFWSFGCPNRVARFVAVELGQGTLLLYLIQGAVFRLMDLIPLGEPWDLSIRVAVAAMLGMGIVVIATTIRRIVQDLGWVSWIVLGAPPRSRCSKLNH